TYTLLSTLPIAPAVTPASLMGGSVGGSVTDANFNGVGGAATAPGMPLYAGLMDGVSVLPIYPDPNAWNVTFQGETVNIPSVNAGLPGPVIPGPAVINDIGIQNQFTLTPGDRVALTAFFVVTPEPSSCVLMMLGVAALVGRRR
ncbi:MAG TPA: PEP-CTERM sorting domain-containing protein, partial [Phycisphaerae bacterium]|nr:PEP-CTERM sorting domain-containing protein [Phycisphaerae bacterium]